MSGKRLLHSLKKSGKYYFSFSNRLAPKIKNDCICSKKKVQFLPRVINALVTLLRDSSVLVIKRVIQGMASIYKNAIQWICTTADITDDLEAAWNSLVMIKVKIIIAKYSETRINS